MFRKIILSLESISKEISLLAYKLETNDKYILYLASYKLDNQIILIRVIIY